MSPVEGHGARAHPREAGEDGDVGRGGRRLRRDVSRKDPILVHAGGAEIIGRVCGKPGRGERDIIGIGRTDQRGPGRERVRRGGNQHAEQRARESVAVGREIETGGIGDHAGEGREGGREFQQRGFGWES